MSAIAASPAIRMRNAGPVWVGDTLNDRLAKLVAAGVMSRLPYSEHPARHEYRLTDSGRDLWPALSAMRQWGDQHGAPGRPRMRSVHIECGTPLRTATVCDSCGVPVGGHEAQLRQVPKRAPRTRSVR
jgi:HxlR-like helix-turn-helix